MVWVKARIDVAYDDLERETAFWTGVVGGPLPDYLSVQTPDPPWALEVRSVSRSRWSVTFPPRPFRRPRRSRAYAAAGSTRSAWTYREIVRVDARAGRSRPGGTSRCWNGDRSSPGYGCPAVLNPWSCWCSGSTGLTVPAVCPPRRRHLRPRRRGTPPPRPRRDPGRRGGVLDRAGRPGRFRLLRHRPRPATGELVDSADDPGGPGRLGVGGGEALEGLVGVEPAGVGYHPQWRPPSSSG